MMLTDVRTVALMVLGCLLVSCAGTQLGEALNAGTTYINLSEPFLFEAYKAEQRACLDLAEAEQDPCIARVRSKWAPVRQAGKVFRRLWCATDAALGTGDACEDASGNEPQDPSATQ